MKEKILKYEKSDSHKRLIYRMECNKMDKRKVSVIVPVYNAEKYLNRAIDSLVRQTLEDIEIILVDDGATDNSPRICDEYAQKDNRIIVIHKENSGQAIARNVGLEAANRKIHNVFRC